MQGQVYGRPISSISPKIGQVFVHVKSKGRYRVLEWNAMRESDLYPVVVYRCLSTQQVWVRPRSEFCDGRFQPEDDRPSD